MNIDLEQYLEGTPEDEKQICYYLSDVINKKLPEAGNKLFHRHPVWFLEDNPIIGYSKIKAGVRLFFWSGASFEEDNLIPTQGKFKDASIVYTNINQIVEEDLSRWILKSKDIQWDYKNLIKRKGELLRLK